MSLTVGAISTILDDTYYNSWPSVARMASGDLIVLYTKGQAHFGNNNSNPDIKIGVESPAGTITWGAEANIYDHATLKVSGSGVFVSSTGRVFATLWRDDELVSATGEAGIVYSDDNGLTWSGWIALTNGFTQEAYGAGPVVELANGDLLVTIEGSNLATAVAHRSSHTVRSTDGGLTWGSEVTIRDYADDLRPYYETVLVLLSTGTLLAVHRTSDTASTNYISTSTDSGLTWSAPVSAFDGYARPNTIELSSGSLLAITRRNSNASAVAFTSPDQGATWSALTVLDATMYEMEYGQAVELQDGRILVVYASQPTSSNTNADIKQVYLTETGTPGVWIDWGLDGFGDSGTADEPGLLARMFPEGGTTAYSDNITTDVRSFTWQRGGTGDLLGGAGQDSATIIVKNTLGKYNPDNTGSVLYGLLKPGKPVWIGANADGTLSGTGQTVSGVFAGRLREIAPIPAGGATDAPEVELICDGILADYARTPVRVADSTERSQADFRQAVLDAIGETRYSLADEPDTLPLSSADSRDALSVLEQLNEANGSRHTIVPSFLKERWYVYTSYNRQHKLGVTPTIALNAGSDHLTALDGLRLNAETVINDQEATVDPIDFPLVSSNIWEYANAPFDVAGNFTIWADFGDYVADPILVVTSSGAAVTSTLTPFGKTAKITLYSTGATITRLYVEGRAVIRNATIKVNTDLSPFAAPSTATYGSRSGSLLSGDLLGARAAAQGLVDHIVYRYHDPLRRPRITLINWIPGIFTTSLYDPTTLTVSQFDMTARWFDIVGIEGSCDLAASPSVLNWQVAYQLQEASLQSAVTFFTLNTSTLGGSDVLGY